MGQRVTYRGDRGTSEGYLALPAASRANGAPAVIVIHEWWGVVPHITAVADRFADEGFIALVPDLYRGIESREPDAAGKLLMGLAMDQAAQEVAQAARYLRARPEVTGKVGVVGFCVGGSLALWSATRSEDIVAAVGFYPLLPWERMSPSWSDYVGKIAMIHCAEEDGDSATAGVQVVKRCIEQAGGKCVLYDYPGTRHAFFNDDRPHAYDRAASVRAWARTLELLRSELG
ncbi:MAG TPA: dienelactone hydrolase family protein [Micromonospora sp.]|jgi:carboxymethylenebutenolidase